MKIALFGGTGFVGSYLIKELISQSYKTKALVRSDSDSILKDNAEIIIGDINDKESVEQTIEGVDTIIYNIGIIREFPKEGVKYFDLHYTGVKTCINIAEKKKIKRFILMSANGVKSNGTGYQSTKFKAEKELEKSDLDWTIFRPSLIFGAPLNKRHQEFCSQIRDTMLNLPIPAPLFHTGLLPINAGKFKLSPIHVQNVSEFFVNSIGDSSTFKKTYNLGGKEAFTWKQIIHLIAVSSGKRTWKIPAPIFAIKLIASLMDRFKWFPVTKDQLTMLIEGNEVKEQYFSDFNVDPIEFNQENLGYLIK